jgi:precorrin-3B synthase
VKAAPQIKGWCPSAWRPMLTGDGYLVRLHFACGILSSEQAHAIASLAQRFGNGFIDLTRRANLQIRSVAGERIAAFQAELLASGLVAQDASGADIPNVIASPLAGRDRTALVDIRPIVRELEERFAHDARARDLPAKSCISLSDCGRFWLRDVAADIGFEAHAADQFAVRIGGEMIGFIVTEEIAETALALAAGFVSLQRTLPAPAPRMRHLIDALGVSAISGLCPALRRASAKSLSARHDADRRDEPGHDAVGMLGDDVLGIGAPFGSLSADQLQLLAELAERDGDRELRLTPWRSILIPEIAAEAGNHLEAECKRAGLITEAVDPRRHIAACAGAPACAAASVKTREIAARLAPLLRRGNSLHVSGCAKSCASSASASVTLVGGAGRFDLIRNGNVSDRPVLFGLVPGEAQAAVERMNAEDFAHV